MTKGSPNVLLIVPEYIYHSFTMNLCWIPLLPMICTLIYFYRKSIFSFFISQENIKYDDNDSI